MEGRCPRFCKEDARDILSQLQQGRIFANFTDEEREKVWESLCSIDHVITSLYTLLKDLTLLYTCGESLFHLIKPPLRKRKRKYEAGTKVYEAYTTDERLRKCFHGNEEDETVKLEVSSRDCRRVRMPIEDRFDFAQRQLWLFLIRHYKSIPRQRQSHNRKLLAKAEHREADEDILSEFATLAHDLGFTSPDIERLRRQMPHTQQCSIAPLQSTGSPRRRNGIPHNCTYEGDKELLFLHNLHRHVSEENFTSFFVLKSVYLAFFGSGIGDSRSFEFTPSVLEEISKPAQDQHAETLSAADKQKQPSCEEPAVQAPPSCEEPSAQIQTIYDKRKRDSAEQVKRNKIRRTVIPSTITFQIWKDSQLEVIQNVEVTESCVREAAEKYMLNGLRPFSTEPKPLLAAEVFEFAISSGLYTVVLLPESDLNIDTPLLEAMAGLPRVRYVI